MSDSIYQTMETHVASLIKAHQTDAREKECVFDSILVDTIDHEITARYYLWDGKEASETLHFWQDDENDVGAIRQHSENGELIVSWGDWDKAFGEQME